MSQNRVKNDKDYDKSRDLRQFFKHKKRKIKLKLWKMVGWTTGKSRSKYTCECIEVFPQ